MSSVRVESEQAMLASSRHTSSLSSPNSLAEDENLSSTIQAMIDDPTIESRFDIHPQEFAVLMRRVDALLESAFDRAEDEADRVERHGQMKLMRQVSVLTRPVVWPASSMTCARSAPTLVMVQSSETVSCP